MMIYDCFEDYLVRVSCRVDSEQEILGVIHYAIIRMIVSGNDLQNTDLSSM